jgi:hypothetical protein
MISSILIDAPYVHCKFFPTTVPDFNIPPPPQMGKLSVSESQLHCLIFHINQFRVS